MKTLILTISVCLITLLSFSQTMRGVKCGMTKDQVITLEKTKGTSIVQPYLDIETGKIDEFMGELVYNDVNMYGVTGDFRYKFNKAGILYMFRFETEYIIDPWKLVKYYGNIVDAESIIYRSTTEFTTDDYQNIFYYKSGIACVWNNSDSNILTMIGYSIDEPEVIEVVVITHSKKIENGIEYECTSETTKYIPKK